MMGPARIAARGRKQYQVTQRRIRWVHRLNVKTVRSSVSTINESKEHTFFDRHAKRPQPFVTLAKDRSFAIVQRIGKKLTAKDVLIVSISAE